jgi:hypothetical protein
MEVWQSLTNADLRVVALAARLAFAKMPWDENCQRCPALSGNAAA